MFSDYISCKRCSEALPLFNIRDIILHCKSCSSIARPSGDNTFMCVLCEYHTRNSEHIKRHIRKHTGDKPYKCSYCDYRSSRNDTLVSHMKVRHGRANWEKTLTYLSIEFSFQLNPPNFALKKLNGRWGKKGIHLFLRQLKKRYSLSYSSKL